MSENLWLLFQEVAYNTVGNVHKKFLKFALALNRFVWIVLKNNIRLPR